MGTTIELELGGLSLSYAKNHRGLDHGALFQDSDRRAARSDQISNEDFHRQGDDPTPMEMAFVRKLKYVVPRLDLLGYTLEQARHAYGHCVLQWREERDALADPGDAPIPEPLSFDQFCALANRRAVTDLDDNYHDNHADRGSEMLRKGRLVADQAEIDRIPRGLDHEDMFWSEKSYFGSCIDVLHPYFLLRILAGNTVNSETDVIWQYGPLVDAGWATIAEFTPSARRTDSFLIVTEGSSDTHILKHGYALLRPGIADFLRFIDVSERHPFPGTGNLLKFAEGLAKIDVLNKIVFVFDNDAEGSDAFQKLAAMVLPSNLRSMILPSLDAFRSFPTRGPEGNRNANINGRAAAIECYLDHRLNGCPPCVIWTNYKSEADIYQGVLARKEFYTKAFLKVSRSKLSTAGYDTANIEKVLDAITEQCISMVSHELA